MPARPPSAFVSNICETLARLGDVRARRMFGGYGISCDGLTFALVADETLYFKVDATNRAAHEALGLEPFRPFADKPTALSYHPPPDSALDDPDELLDWARPALEAALRAAAAKRSKRTRKTVAAG
ncbi:DNA transformation protein [Azospirillum agricola]|uniref:TfoX/Sxy family protein n=1 Tax=Azospirillum agricola TaxID=1720247 RepID=UPI001AE43BFD|nr:TfoX/Sxy family protein [Azospirillum agricola]MBP2230576.1 DNA transformation protein [Azospirillum agricola]